MIYQFGPFRLDTGTRELTRNGERRETEPKAFDVLCYLAEHNDRAVSKDELQDKLWPHTIVTETALTRSIMKARRAVGDDANQQSVIRTVHGHGYRFVATLENTDPVAAASDTPITDVAAVKRLMPRWTIALTSLVVIAVIAYVGYQRGTRAPEPEPITQRIAILPIDSQVNDDNLSWVRVGLMSLLGKMLEDRGLGVAGDRAILSLVDSSPVPIPMDQPYLQRVQSVASASDVLQTTLTRDGNVYSLSAVLSGNDGKHIRRTVVADSVTTAAADLAGILASLYSGGTGAPEQRLRRVSVDPFINEAYARALDLELAGKLEEARTLFEIAAEQAPKLFWLRYEIAICTRDLREYELATQQFATLLDEARAAHDTPAEIATLNSIAVMNLALEDFDAAEEVLQSALLVANDSLYASDRATIHVNLALVARNRDDAATAFTHFSEAQLAFEEAEIQPTPSFLNNFAGMYISNGQFDIARDYSEQAVAGFRLRGQRRYEAIALNRLAKILRRQGDIDGALARYEQSMSIQEELGNEFGAVAVLASMTAVYRAKGDFTRGRLNANEAVRRAAALDHTTLSADAHMFLAQVEEDLQNATAARTAYTTARDMFATVGTPPGLRYAEEGIARTTLNLGDVQRADALAQTLLATARDSGNERAIGRAMMLQGSISEARGDVNGALSQYNTVYEAALKRDDISQRDSAAIEVARIYLDQGLSDAAEELLPAEPDDAINHEQKRQLARLRYAQGDVETAVALLSNLQQEAGEAWQADDDALLRSFRN